MNNNNTTTTKNGVINLMESSAYAEFIPYLLENRPVLVTFPDLTNLNTFFRQLFVHDHGRTSNGSPITVTVEYSSATNVHGDKEGNPPSSLSLPEAQEQENGYARPRISMTLEEFLQHITNNHDNSTNSNEKMYLKDFHIDPLLSSNSPGKALYTIPECFRDDWLNWYWQHVRQSEDDYSFAYAGTPGTTTLIHHDVSCSYSWSVNLTGHKRWLLWPPKYAHQLLQQKGERSNTENVDDVDIGCVDNTVSDSTDNSASKHVTSKGKYEFDEGGSDSFLITDARNFPHARQHAVIIEQGVGQALFVPSGWYHQVENIMPNPITMLASSSSPSSSSTAPDTDTDEAKCNSTRPDPMASLIISLNRNWFNGFNVHEVWLFLIRELTSVRAELWHLHPDSVAFTSTTASPATGIDTVVMTAGGRTEHKTTPNSSMCMNMHRGEELLCMDRDEWYHHCDTILKANAATNVSEFVEVLAARVLMMLSTKTMLQNRVLRCNDESSCTSGDHERDDGEDVNHILDFASNAIGSVPVPGHTPPSPAWAAVFCPRYDPHQPPSTDDLDLARIQLTTKVSPQTQSTEHLLSTYHTGITRYDTSQPWSLFSPTEWDNVIHNKFESNVDSPSPSDIDNADAVDSSSIPRRSTMCPKTAWQHTCTEIERILSGMISSIEFIRHLTSSCYKVSTSAAAAAEVGVDGLLDDGKIGTIRYLLMELRTAMISLVR